MDVIFNQQFLKTNFNQKSLSFFIYVPRPLSMWEIMTIHSFFSFHIIQTAS